MYIEGNHYVITILCIYTRTSYYEGKDSTVFKYIKEVNSNYDGVILGSKVFKHQFKSLTTGKYHYFDENGNHAFEEFKIEQENNMYTDTPYNTPYISTNYLAKVEDDKENFVIVNKSGGGILGSATTLEEAKTKAQKALKQDSDFYIFQAVARVTPKPLDADIEEL